MVQNVITVYLTFHPKGLRVIFENNKYCTVHWLQINSIICMYVYDFCNRIYAFFHSVVSPSVAIDGYTHNKTLSSGDTIKLGTRLLLVCWVVGLPYGTPLYYNWTCPNGCIEVGDYGRRIYDQHILAVNTTSTHDGGTYTCHVKAMYLAMQEFSGSFTISVAGEYNKKSI